MKHFKASADHDTELVKYAIVAYVKCISNMIKLMIEMGIEAAVLVLTEAKNLYGPPASLSRTTRVELYKANLTAGED